MSPSDLLIEEAGRGLRFELRTGVAVDLESDTDLDDFRRRPSFHDFLPTLIFLFGSLRAQCAMFDLAGQADLRVMRCLDRQREAVLGLPLLRRGRGTLFRLELHSGAIAWQTTLFTLHPRTGPDRLP